MNRRLVKLLGPDICDERDPERLARKNAAERRRYARKRDEILARARAQYPAIREARNARRRQLRAARAVLRSLGEA